MLVRGQARGEIAGPEQGKGVSSGQVDKKRPPGDTDLHTPGQVSHWRPVLVGTSWDAFTHPSPAHPSGLPIGLRQNQGLLQGPPRAQPHLRPSQVSSQDTPIRGSPGSEGMSLGSSFACSWLSLAGRFLHQCQLDGPGALCLAPLSFLVLPWVPGWAPLLRFNLHLSKRQHSYPLTCHPTQGANSALARSQAGLGEA